MNVYWSPSLTWKGDQKAFTWPRTEIYNTTSSASWQLLLLCLGRHSSIVNFALPSLYSYLFSSMDIVRGGAKKNWNHLNVICSIVPHLSQITTQCRTATHLSSMGDISYPWNTYCRLIIYRYYLRSRHCTLQIHHHSLPSYSNPQSTTSFKPKTLRWSDAKVQPDNLGIGNQLINCRILCDT